jgi:DNA-binding CsgD family transcriptional regulator
VIRVSSAGRRAGTGPEVGSRRGFAPQPADEHPLERGREQVALDAALAAACDASGQIVFLEGAPGLGKTLLLSLVAQRAQERGIVALRARGGELERQFPFGVALQLYEPYLSAATPRERDRVLAGAAAHAAPILSGREEVGGVSGQTEFGLLHGLHWVAANIAERRPLLLAIDDAHAADDASLRALLYTAQRIEDLALAIVLTARPLPASATSGDALSMLASHGLVRRLELAPLSEDGIAAIVRAQLPEADDAFCAACARVTSGNPFFARELLAELTAGEIVPSAEHAARVGEVAPLTIARAVGTRLERLSPAATPLARAVAVLGDPAPLAHATALAGLARRAAADAADELAGADILRPPPDLSFVHPIVRQAVYLGIPAADRAQLHLDAAQLLRNDGAGVERAAPHLLHAMPAATGTGNAWVVACLHAGARRALSGGSPETAARFLLRALEESPPPAQRAELLIDLGRAEALAGLPSALERLRTAVTLLEEPGARARALAQLGHALYAAADNPGAASAFDEGLRVLDGADPVLEEELTAGYLGAARLDFRTREAALTRFKDLLSGSSEATTTAQRELLAQRGLEHAMLGDTPCDDAVALIERALDGERLLREVSADAVAYAGAAAALLFCDALATVETATSAGLQDARRRGSVVGFALMSAIRGACRYLRGDGAGALADLEGGLEPVPVMALVRPFAHGWKALALLDRGELEQAERVLDACATDDAQQDRYFTYNWPLFARGRLALATGDPARALDVLLECGRRQVAIPAPNPAVLPWRSEAALAAWRLGRSEQAHELADEELRLARAFGAPRALGIALRAAGVVRDDDVGLALLEQAVAALERSPARLERSRALIELGAAQRHAGLETLARTTLRDGLDAAHHCGAHGLAAAARAELVAAGARPRRPAAHGAEALTPSELRVSELAEQGLTNREIAQALFISTKTVEFHLRNAYLKLHIASRRELPAALRGRNRRDADQARP